MPNQSTSLHQSNAGRWLKRPFHRHYLMEQGEALLGFFQRGSVNAAGGFHELDTNGQPFPSGAQMLPWNTRMVHCFAVGSLLGRPGSDDLVDHGMRYIHERHRDATKGGYFWSVDENGAQDGTKQAYGHAFVLLAASGARLVGHPLADAMIADVTDIINMRFWDETAGAVAEEFAADWSEITDYRGQNSNMHLTEALMAAFEATGESDYLRKAERIAELIIGRHAKGLDYRVAEHFNAAWDIDEHYAGNEMFRPSGLTPGHWLEWSRLLLQLWVLGGKQHAWMGEAARHLFRQAVTLGWDRTYGGFYYTLDFANRPMMREKLWWPVTEAIGAAAFLTQLDDDPFFETWYRKLWDFADRNFIDHAAGGWFPELGEDLAQKERLFRGKPDIYHCLQACLIPLYPPIGSLTHAIIAENGAG